MSNDWVQDIEDMHTKYGVNEKVRQFDKEKLKQFLEFRVRFLEEELNELKENIDNPEEVVDALIDLCVVAIGTLDAFEVNAYRAWNEVHNANMKKQVGIKKNRPNPLGLPDLIKPEGWRAPSHEYNHGLLDNIK
jgi:Phosphoribosyl-ATP pyrophosphohydrolase